MRIIYAYNIKYYTVYIIVFSIVINGLSSFIPTKSSFITTNEFMKRCDVVCIGEILYDYIAEGIFLFSYIYLSI